MRQESLVIVASRVVKTRRQGSSSFSVIRKGLIRALWVV